jgi:hypothetical protein
MRSMPLLEKLDGSNAYSQDGEDSLDGTED